GVSFTFWRRPLCMSNSLTSSASITTDTGSFLRSSLSHTHTRSPARNSSSRPHQPPTLISASASTAHTFATCSPSRGRVTVPPFASTAFTGANGFGNSRRNSAVPEIPFTLSAGSARIVVSGYSAAQANHLTCTPSTHSSVQPFKSPPTHRPATSQNEWVSPSTKRPALFLSARL